MISVVRALDEYIESVTDDRLPDGKYHPSSMFLCDRQVMYGLRGVPTTNPVDFASKRKFYIGHRIHEAVQRAIESAPGVRNFYPEFRASVDELNIEGHGDGLIELDDGTFVVLEIKSTNKWSVRYGLPKEEHKNQVKAYAVVAREHGVWVTDELGNEKFVEPLWDSLIGVLIVYLEKEDLNIWEYFIEWDNAWIDELQDKLYGLDAYRLDPASLPPRLPLKADGKKQWPCNYCPWKDRCWRSDPKEIEPAEVF